MTFSSSLDQMPPEQLRALAAQALQLQPQVEAMSRKIQNDETIIEQLTYEIALLKRHKFANLFIRGIVELSFDPLKLFHLRFELGNFIFKAGSVWRGGARNLSISRIERSQITADARLDFFHTPLQFGAGEIAITVVHCLEFAAVDGNQVFAKQPQLLAEQNELAADAANGLAVVFSEVGDGLEVGHQTPG